MSRSKTLILTITLSVLVLAALRAVLFIFELRSGLSSPRQPTGEWAPPPEEVKAFAARI